MVSQDFSVNQAGALDLFYGGAVSRRAQRAIAPNEFHVTNVLYEGKKPYAVQWELVHNMDWSGGIGKFAGSWEQFNNCYAYATGLDLGVTGYVSPCFADTVANITPTGNRWLMHTHAFDTLIMASGSGTNVSLIKETSATDPTPVAITYNPNSTDHITSLSYVTLNNTRYLVVGLSATVADVLTDANGSDLGTDMDTATAGLWWICQTSIPHASGGFTLLLQAGTTVYTLSSAVAVNTAPTSAQTNIPAGGHLIEPGEFEIGDKPRSVWAWIPKESTTTGGATFGSEKFGEIYYFNPEGQDYKKLTYNEMPNGVRAGAIYIHGGIAAFDDTRVVHHTGDGEDNLEIYRDLLISDGTHPPSAPTTTYFRVRGLGRDGDDLIAQVEAINRTGSTASNLFLYRFDWSLRCWQSIAVLASAQSGASSSPSFILPTSGIPISSNTKATYSLDSKIRVQVITPSGENSYFSYNQTGVSKTFTSGILYSPRWSLPRFQQWDLAGYPSIVYGIGVRGDISATGSYIEVWVTPNSGMFTYGTVVTTAITAKFTAGDAFALHRNQWYKTFPENSDHWYDLSVLLQVNGNGQTTGTLATEMRLRGLTFLDYNVRTPRSVLQGEAFEWN